MVCTIDLYPNVDVIASMDVCVIDVIIFVNEGCNKFFFYRNKYVVM